MPPKRRIIVAATKLERKKARSSMGPLRALLVSKQTLKTRYEPACRSFFEWLLSSEQQVSKSIIGIDLQVSSFLEHLWMEGEGRNAAGDVLSGLSFFCPHLKGHLVASWQLFKAWSRMELPQRAPPLPEEWLWALAALACRRGMGDVCVSLIVAYYGLLRATEAVNLRVAHCTAAAAGYKWVLQLGLTKGGQRRGALESVVIDHPLACVLLRAATHKQPKSALLLRRHVVQFRKIFKSLCNELGLGEFQLQPYSLRRGGATTLFQRKGSFDEVAEHGRWGHTTTAKIYINEGLDTLNQLTLSSTHTDVLQRLGRELWDRCKVEPPL